MTQGTEESMEGEAPDSSVPDGGAPAQPHTKEKRLKAKTINCYLQSIRGFYDYLYDEEGLRIPNPVKRGYALRESKPLRVSQNCGTDRFLK